MGPQPRTLLPKSRGVSMATVQNIQRSICQFFRYLACRYRLTSSDMLSTLAEPLDFPDDHKTMLMSWVAEPSDVPTLHTTLSRAWFACLSRQVHKAACATEYRLSWCMSGPSSFSAILVCTTTRYCAVSNLQVSQRLRMADYRRPLKNRSHLTVIGKV
jgi:hypothetical protein